MPSKKWKLNRSDYPGDIILCGQREYSFGRAKENDHVLISLFVSRKHCVFRDNGNSLSLVDLHSVNGTFVNGYRININEVVTLKEGDVIGFGVTKVLKEDYFVFTLTEKDKIDVTNVQVECKAIKEPDKELVSVKEEIEVKQEVYPSEACNIGPKPNKEVIDVIELSDDEKEVHYCNAPITSHNVEEQSVKSERGNENVVPQNLFIKLEKTDLVSNPPIQQTVPKVDDSSIGVSTNAVNASETCITEFSCANVKIENSLNKDFCSNNINKEKVLTDSANEKEKTTVLSVCSDSKTEQCQTSSSKTSFTLTSFLKESLNIKSEKIDNEELNECSKNLMSVLSTKIKIEPSESKAEDLQENESVNILLDPSVSYKSNERKVDQEPEASSSTSNEEKIKDDAEKWFRSVFLPYLVHLESSKNNAESQTPKNVDSSKRKNDFSLNKEELSQKRIKLSECNDLSNCKAKNLKKVSVGMSMNMSPIVLVEKLDKGKLDELNIKHSEISQTENMECSPSESIEKVSNLQENSSDDLETESGDDSNCPHNLNYSQSDDAVIVIDDDDDEVAEGECNKEHKGEEDMFIKQEIFEDDVEEEDEDDILVVEWVNRLSQTLNVKEEDQDENSDDEIFISRKKNRRRPVISSGSSDELDSDSEKKSISGNHKEITPHVNYFEDEEILVRDPGKKCVSVSDLKEDPTHINQFEDDEAEHIFDTAWNDAIESKNMSRPGKSLIDTTCNNLKENQNKSEITTNFEIDNEEIFDLSKKSFSVNLTTKNTAVSEISKTDESNILLSSTFEDKCLNSPASKCNVPSQLKPISDTSDKIVQFLDDAEEYSSGDSDMPLFEKPKLSNFLNREMNVVSDSAKLDDSDNSPLSNSKEGKCTANTSTETKDSDLSITNRKTILCSALPLKPRRHSKSISEKIEKKKTSRSKPQEFEEQQVSFPVVTDVSNNSGKPKILSNSKLDSSNLERNKNKSDKEARKMKLKALAEKGKERDSKGGDKHTVVSKTPIPVKNTKTSRGDKLVELFVAPSNAHVNNKSELSYKEQSYHQKLKVKVSKEPNVESHISNKKSGSVYKSRSHNSLNESKLQNSTRKKYDTTLCGSLRSNTDGSVSSSTTHEKGVHLSEKPSEIVYQISKLSFKDLPKIPKRKILEETVKSAITSDGNSTRVHEPKGLKKLPETWPGRAKSLPTEVTRTLRPILKQLPSVSSKKSVHFASEEMLCSVKSFLVEHCNNLRPVDAKDAPVRRAATQDARSLFEVSKFTLDEVIAKILRLWNPRWLKEQKEVSKNGDIPPPCYGSNDVNSLIPMLTSFTSYQEYLQIIHPLMLLDLWAEVTEDVDRPINRAKLKFNINVEETMQANGMATLHCSMPLSSNDEREQRHPRMGDLCLIFYPYWNLATATERENFLKEGKSSDDMLLSVFAYVDSASKDYSRKGNIAQFQGNMVFTPGNAGNTFANSSPFTCLLKITIKLKSGKHLTTHQPFVKLQVISNIRSTLRMFEAVGYLNHMKLCQMILQPSIEDYRLPSVKVNFPIVNEDLLDESQKIAVAKAAQVCMRSQPKICMIQGPPGTGKTRVILNIVTKILYPDGPHKVSVGHKRPRILLCAPSNAGVDEIVERLLKIRGQMKREDRFKMVRCGQYCSMRESIRGVSLEELVNKDIEKTLAVNNNTSFESVELEIATQEAKRRSYVMVLEDAANKGRSTEMYKKRIEETEKRIADLRGDSKHVTRHKTVAMEREARRKVLAHADIIATTLTSSFMPHMSEVFASKFGTSIKFTCCIIDEATQCKEPECLIPLMYGIDRVVMVGDPEQLPATVLSKTAKEKSFGQSLFNRIWNKFQAGKDNPVLFLSTQYRMHHEIYEWPNLYIYNGQVKSDPNLNRSGPLKPYCVFSHPFNQTSGMSLFNEKEAQFVSDIAVSIQRSLPDFVDSIGIITPYQKQLHMVRKYIEERNPSSSIVVNTIDGFQGQERDVVIFSCVRSQGIGFLGESQRLNVALTRARYCLIICGNFKSLQEDKMWSSLLNDAVKRGVVIYPNRELSGNEILRYILKS